MAKDQLLRIALAMCRFVSRMQHTRAESVVDKDINDIDAGQSYRRLSRTFERYFNSS